MVFTATSALPFDCEKPKEDMRCLTPHSWIPHLDQSGRRQVRGGDRFAIWYAFDGGEGFITEEVFIYSAASVEGH